MVEQIFLNRRIDNMTKQKDELWLKFEKHLANEGLTKKRIKKLFTMYNVVIRALDLTKAKRDDIENFVNDLTSDKFKRLDGNNFSGSSKSDIKKFLKQFYKWYKGENEYYPKHVSWLKTKIPKDQKPIEKPILELKQVVQLAQKFKKYDYKMLVLALFDSGFRIQEMISVKKKDLTWEEFDSAKKCFWIKCNKSKTYPRKVPIPLFSTEMKSFFDSSYFKAKQDDDPLFDIHYASFTNHLKEHSLKLFNLKITCHCLRHSSCTFYAKEYAGNVPLLAQRFGWSFSAKELSTYVRKSGAYNREGAKVSFRNEVVKLREDNDILKEKVTSQEKQINDISKMIKKLMVEKSINVSGGV